MPENQSGSFPENWQGPPRLPNLSNHRFLGNNNTGVIIIIAGGAGAVLVVVLSGGGPASSLFVA